MRKNTILSIVCAVAMLFCSLTAICSFGTVYADDNDTTVQSNEILPVAHYKFDDESNVGKDSAGNCDLTAYNTPLSQQSEKGACVDFDGNSGLWFKPVGDKDFTDIFPNFTVTYWAKHDALQSTMAFTVGTGVAYTQEGFGQGFYMGNHAFMVPVGNVGNNSDYAANFRTSSLDGFGPYADNYPTSEEWNFYAFKYVSPTEIYYSINGYVYKINGAEAGAKIANLVQTFTIGGIIFNNGTSFANGFDGQIADMRIYAAAIDDAQLKKLADAGVNSQTQVETEGSYIKSVETPAPITAENRDEQSILTSANNTEINVVLSDGSTSKANVFWNKVSFEKNKAPVSGVVSCDGAANAQNTKVYMNVILKGGIKTNGIFTNNAVLQRGKAVVYGTADDNLGIVKVSYGETVKQTTISNYAWSVDLGINDAVFEGKTLKVEYAADSENFVAVNEYSNVRVGEVWLCSGQSNMAITIEYIANKDDTVNGLYSTATNWENISIFNVPYAPATTPANSVAATWSVPTSLDAAKAVSALATAYAVQLQSVLKDVPVGIIVSAVGGSCIEEWIDADSMKTLPSNAQSMNKNDSYLYNGMINPLSGYGIKGILWYQGEANVLHCDDYVKQFNAYVKKYRNIFNDSSLPIITVQLPQYCDWTTWTDFRETQWNLQNEIENLYVVCAIDLGDNTSPHQTAYDNDCIHPSDKWALALRTTGLAAVKVYGINQSESPFDIPYDVSPYAVSAEETKDGILIKTSAQIIKKADKYQGFWTYADREWKKAEAEWVDGNLLIKGNSQKITAVRYLYENIFDDSLVFATNEAGLPLAPFKKIEVKPITEFTVTLSITGTDKTTTTTTFTATLGQTFVFTAAQLENVNVKVLVGGQEIQGENGKYSVVVENDTSIEIIYESTVSDSDQSDTSDEETTGCTGKIDGSTLIFALFAMAFGVIIFNLKRKSIKD